MGRVRYEGSPHNPDRIERLHSCNGPWTHECCFEVVNVYVGSGLRYRNYQYCYYDYHYDNYVLKTINCLRILYVPTDVNTVQVDGLARRVASLDSRKPHTCGILTDSSATK